jgi:hypothetical protein
VADVDAGARVAEVVRGGNVLQIRAGNLDATREQQTRQVPHPGPADPDHVHSPDRRQVGDG